MKKKRRLFVLSKYIKNSKLNTTSSWQYYFRQDSFLESFEHSGKNTGKEKSYFLFKSARDISDWLGEYDVDVCNPKNVDYQLVHNKLDEFLEILRAGDKVGLEKFMETLDHYNK